MLTFLLSQQVNVIQYYQTILYKSLGIGAKSILLLAAAYGTCAFLSNCVTTRYLLDQWGRRPMFLTGLGSIVVIEIYAAVMQRQFQDTSNRVGKGFAILGIYLFVLSFYGMLMSPTYLYGAEVMPVSLRSKVGGIAGAAHFIVNVGITEAGPSAFSSIHENVSATSPFPLSQRRAIMCTVILTRTASTTMFLWAAHSFSLLWPTFISPRPDRSHLRTLPRLSVTRWV